MGFNFPNSPALGATYSPPGGPIFEWDGQKWLAIESSAREVWLFETRTEVEDATIPAAVGAIETAGYAAPGDGGGAKYKRGAVGTAGGVTSADGAGWELGRASSPKEINIIATGAEEGVDAKPALVAAMGALGVLGGRVIIPAGDWDMSSGITVPEGVTLEFDPKARVICLDQAAHLFLPQGDNRFIDPHVVGLWDGVTPAVGFAAFAMIDTSGVVIERPILDNLLGDMFRIEDSSWIYIDDARGVAGRNVASLNDDVTGSSHVFFRRGRVSSYLIGFDAESDDDFPVSDVEVDIDWTQLGGSQQGSAIAFTRAVSPASSLIKYSRLRLSAKSKDGLYGIVLRGAKDIDIFSLVTEGVQRGIWGGAGHHIEDLRLHSFDIQATHNGIYIENPAGVARCRGVRIGAGRIYGITQASSIGIFSGADETVISEETLVDLGGAATSTGVRLDGDLSRTAATVCDARTSFVHLSAPTATAILKAAGGTFKAATGNPVNEVTVAGSSPNVEIRDNLMCGTSTGMAISDASRMALHEGNRGGDLFRGYVLTTDATPALVMFEGARAYIPVPAGRSYYFIADIISRRSDGSTGTGAAYRIAGLIRNTTGSVAFDGTATTTVVGEYSTDAASLNATAAATASGLTITVTGVAGKSQAWNATVQILEV